jgi:hypothetical protein
MSWIKIEERKFRSGDIVDIWSKWYGRLADYRFAKDYGGQKGNDFFEPSKCGPACIRDATHFMYIPKDPESN